MYKYKDYEKAADFLKSKLKDIPGTALVLGSGLGGIKDDIKNSTVIHYSEIPNFPLSTNSAHECALFCGDINNTPLLVFSGRVHCYEGYSAEQAAFYVIVCALIGVENIIITNAAGGIAHELNPGDIMLITDHINLFGDSPFSSEHDERFGKKFYDMTYAYSRNLLEIAHTCAKAQNIKLQDGVYYYCKGPRYETPAEIGAMRVMGASAVGMSTVPEVTAAARLGLSVLGFSLITNKAAGETAEKLDDNEVVITAKAAGNTLASLIKSILRVLYE